jgi:uncharacterized 2Fe-2S/4Fe-4S cluster protein (DUF4445 family)
MKYKVVFQPSGQQGVIEAGKTLLEAAQELGVNIETVCGQKRLCGKCRVIIQEGYFERFGITSSMAHLLPLTPEEGELLAREEKEDHYRLACAAIIQGELLVLVPEESRAAQQVVRKTTRSYAIPCNPAIHKYYVELAPPTLADPRGDLERLILTLEESFALNELSIDPKALQELPNALRDHAWKVTVSIWQGKEIQKVEPGRVDRALGLAVDIGTTTVVGYLCDLKQGTILATASFMNPQVSYGEDVMSRISYLMNNPDGLRCMHEDIIQTLGQIAWQATKQIGASPKDILEMTVVGNTVMHHIFLGIDPKHIGLSPFPPVSQQSHNIKARDLGLELSPGANIYVLPIEAGFVGADNVGVIIDQEPYNTSEPVLIIDIGTNGEIVLGNQERLLSASCATGPAFEGAHIKWGMRAAPGAIERVRIDPVSYEVSYQVIKNPLEPHSEIKPKGICGSGIIDAVAQMYKTNIIQKTGAFNPNMHLPRLRKIDKGQEFVIAWAEETAVGKDITISSEDVRAVQLAKGALYAGAKVLLRKWGIPKPNKVVLAGAFGNYIDKAEAMRIGLFPDMDLEQVYSVGNAAGEGACLALCNIQKRLEAERIARQVEYIELTLEPEFEEEFIQALHFPHMKDVFRLVP